MLRAWGGGHREALDELVPLVYAELRRLSRSQLRRRPRGATLETDALVNEAFVRLVDRQTASWQDRTHFLGIAASTMRDILVHRARHAGAQKRGGGDRDLTLEDGAFVVKDQRELLALEPRTRE